MKDEKKDSSLSFRGSQITGIDTGAWCSYGLPGEYPGDQQADNGRSLTFTSLAVETPVDILGFPQVKLTLAVDHPAAFVAVRLSDVAPDGSSALVSWGVLNLTHRESHEFPAPVPPGERMTITIPLKVIGYTLPAGHRWCLAVSPTQWPHVWPSPKPVTLTLFMDESCELILPVRPPQPEDAHLRPFDLPEVASPLPVETLRTANMERYKQTDVVTGRTEVQNRFDSGRVRYPDHGLEVEDITTDTYTIIEGDPLSAMVRSDRFLAYQCGDWQVRLETSSTMTADTTYFHISNLLDAYEGAVRVFSKSWTFRIPRDLV